MYTCFPKRSLILHFYWSMHVATLPICAYWNGGNMYASTLWKGQKVRFLCVTQKLSTVFLFHSINIFSLLFAVIIKMIRSQFNIYTMFKWTVTCHHFCSHLSKWSFLCCLHIYFLFMTSNSVLQHKRSSHWSRLQWFFQYNVLLRENFENVLQWLIELLEGGFYLRWRTWAGNMQFTIL